MFKLYLHLQNLIPFYQHVSVQFLKNLYCKIIHEFVSNRPDVYNCMNDSFKEGTQSLHNIYSKINILACSLKILPWTNILKNGDNKKTWQI